VLVDPGKIDFFPNVSRLKKASHQSDFRKLEIVYLSTISFDYTLSSFLHILEACKNHQSQLKNVHFTVIGDGEGLPKLQENIQNLKLESFVTCVGYHPDPADILSKADLALIPWEKDMMTETMLPTKLFEYLSLSLPVLAPRFGEFVKILSHRSTALLYSNPEEAVSNIKWCKQHTDEMKAIGTKGNKLFNSTYTPEIIEKRFLEFYRKA
jgi:glycosyltransferase involved in cell wall biosynthesis